MNTTRNAISNHFAKYLFLYLAFAISILIFLIIANPSGMYFQNDDFVHIPMAASGDFFYRNFLRPVSDMTLWLDSQVWGKNAVGFHITNLLLNVTDSILAFIFFRKMFVKDDARMYLWKALMAAVLFLFFAFHSESVFWIIGRGGSLAAFFILVSLNIYLYHRNWTGLLLSLFSFCIGLFAYEFVWILPAIILVLQVKDFYSARKPLWVWSISFMVVFLVFLMLRQNVRNVYFSDYEANSFLHWRIPHLFYNYCMSLVRCFVPPIKNTFVFIGIGSGLLLCLLLFIYRLKNKRRLRSLVTPAVFLFISCLPSISLGIDSHDTEGERFLYVPSIFVCWLLVEFIFIFPVRMKTAIGTYVVLLLIHMYFLNQSADTYRYAGRIVLRSISCLNAVPFANKLVVEGLPSQYRGALIFRNGFEDAVDWLLPGKFQSIQVLSSREIVNQTDIHCKLYSDMTGKEVHIQWVDQ